MENLLGALENLEEGQALTAGQRTAAIEHLKSTIPHKVRRDYKIVRDVRHLIALGLSLHGEYGALRLIADRYHASESTAYRAWCEYQKSPKSESDLKGAGRENGKHGRAA